MTQHSSPVTGQPYEDPEFDIVARLRAAIDPDVNEPLDILLAQAAEVIEQYRSDSARDEALIHAQSTLEDMARLSASEVACYRWPEDTAEHRAMRAAFCDGAAHTAVTSTVHSPQQETAHSSTDSNTTEKTKGGAAPYTLEETEPHIEAPYGYTPQATAEGE